jgi:hypothetical protein
MALPNQPSHRKPSSVPLAPTPEVMQKIGVEQCQVDPADHTEEILGHPRVQLQPCSSNNKNFWSVFNWNIRGVNAKYKSPVLHN